MAFDLMGLPAELRLMVIDHAFRISGGYDKTLTPWVYNTMIGPRHPLIKVCRTLRDESSPLYYENNTITFDTLAQLSEVSYFNPVARAWWHDVKIRNFDFPHDSLGRLIDQRFTFMDKLPHLRRLTLGIGRTWLQGIYGRSEFQQWMCGEADLHLSSHFKVIELVLEGSSEYSQGPERGIELFAKTFKAVNDLCLWRMATEKTKRKSHEQLKLEHASAETARVGDNDSMRASDCECEWCHTEPEWRGSQIWTRTRKERKWW